MPLTKFFGLKLFSTFAVLVLADQILKNAALAFLSSGLVVQGGFLSFEIYKNFGIVFGIPFPNGLFYFAVFIFLVLLFAGRIFDSRQPDKYQAIGLVFLLAGATGNIIDRLRWGYIIDFVNIKGMFAFNPADVFIAIGTIMMLENFLSDTGRGKLIFP